MTTETCAATKLSPTATGDVSTRCTKRPDHVAAGDPVHEGRQGVFPVRWQDAAEPSVTSAGETSSVATNDASPDAGVTSRGVFPLDASPVDEPLQVRRVGTATA